jgi:hypothetical protein
MKAPGIPDERLPGNARPSNLCRLSEHPDGLEEAKAWLSGLPDRNLTLMVVGTSWMTVVLFNVRTSRRRDMTVDRLSEVGSCFAAMTYSLTAEIAQPPTLTRMPNPK